MQQIFLFFTMLIAASEAFLNGSHISTSCKKKISGFVPIIKSGNPVFGKMNFPVQIDAKPGIISNDPTFLSLCARHRRFLNGDRTTFKELGNVSFSNGRRNSSRRLRLMSRKRKLTSSFPGTKTMNLNLYPGRENLNVPSITSLFHSSTNSNKFYGKAPYRKSRKKVVKKRQIRNSYYWPFNSKQLLKYSKPKNERKDFKRRIGSTNVKKFKRNAKTVNGSQGNVTKNMKEKSLNEQSNSYSRDLRPEFATRHLDNIPSKYENYLKLNSQPVSPYLLPFIPDDTDYYDSVLDTTPPSMCIPRMGVLVPYNRKIYEDANFEDDNNDAKFFRKSETEELIESKEQKEKRKRKKIDSNSESYRLNNLKRMLDEVENALKEEKGNSRLKMTRKGVRVGGKPGDSEESIRAKIDVVIPLLSQISQDLGKRSKQLQRSAPLKTSNIPDEEGERKEEKQNNKKCSNCNLDGIWLSHAMALEINLTTQHTLMLKVHVKPLKRDAPINDRWSIHGLTLSKTEGPFILAAICPGKRKIASFIGQCWICDEDEYVYGSWTIYKKEENISDLLTAVDTRLDVLSRKREKDEVT